MESDLSLITGVVIFLLTVISCLFITFSVLLHNEQEKVRQKLGDKIFEWLIRD